MKSVIVFHSQRRCGHFCCRNAHREAEPFLLQCLHGAVAIGFNDPVSDQFYQSGAVGIFTPDPAKEGLWPYHFRQCGKNARAGFNQRTQVRERLGDAIKTAGCQIGIGFIKRDILFDLFDARFAAGA